MSIRLSALAVLALMVTGFSRSISAQDSVTIVAGPQYEAGWLHRVLLGSRYREIWTTPIRVAVLDLDRFAGGLTPVRRGGGQQTTSLRFRAADGREFTFRSVDKDPSSILPEGLRATVAGNLLQDQISAGHPVGALVVAELLDAADVLHADPVLRVMPDDPRLGTFRTEFAGMLGLFEERPDEQEDRDMGFAAAIQIVGTESFLDRIEKDPTIRPDSRAFLRARLMDVFLGDWDRHRDQWRWALTDQDGPHRWLPIPRDRDQAFARYDGIFLGLAREAAPQLVRFGPQYANPVGQTWNGRDLDRRLLSDLEWPAWEEVASEIRGRLTDDVLQRAVGVLPAEYVPFEHKRLLAALTTRRDYLVDAARDYYRLLAREVDIHATDQADSAVVARLGSGVVAVSLWAPDMSTPYYSRRFTGDETKDLRVWLHGDDDRGVVRGDGEGPTVRFLGGGGDDMMVDSAESGRTRFYDARGTNRGIGRTINTKPYVTIADSNPAVLPPRDWGTRFRNLFLLSIAPDVGLFVSANPTFYRYAFRKRPYASRVAMSVGWATSAATFNGTIEGDWWEENSRVRWGFRARGSGIETLRWYGRGNNTPNTGSREFNRVTQHAVGLSTHLGVEFGAHSFFEVGPMSHFSVTEVDDGQNVDRFIAIDRPYGSGDFGHVGVEAKLMLDGRDRPVGARHGVYLSAYSMVSPIVFGTDGTGGTFGSVAGETGVYLTPAGANAPTLALRAGGKRVWGDYPFFDAATLGGRTARGFYPGRFAGDGVLYGNAEARVKLFDATLVVPGEVGVFGLGDVGRVWVDGEDSDTWHTTVGGGVWFSVLSGTSTLSLSLGHSREGNRFYLGSGFGF